MGRWPAGAGHLLAFRQGLVGPLVGLTLAGASCLVAAASLEGYRLAGTVAVGSGHVGVLELPEGGQVLVREGSEVAGGRVVRLSGRTLQVAFPDGDLVLPLQGLPRPADAPLPAYVTGAVQSDAIAVREVEVEPLRRALRAAGQAGAPGKPGPGRASAPEPGAADPAEANARDPAKAVTTELARRFAPLVGLPAEARIVEPGVGSPEELVALVEARLRDGSPVGLNVEGVPGLERVYLVPQGSGALTAAGVPGGDAAIGPPPAR